MILSIQKILIPIISKQIQIQKYYYLLYWTCDDQRFEILENLWQKFFVPCFQIHDLYFEEINGNKYSPLVPTNETKEKIQKFEKLWIKIRDLIRSITKNGDDHDEKYMKIKLCSDNELPLSNTIEIPTITIVVRTVFHENNKCYPKAFLDECLYKI